MGLQWPVRKIVKIRDSSLLRQSIFLGSFGRVSYDHFRLPVLGLIREFIGNTRTFTDFRMFRKVSEAFKVLDVTSVLSGESIVKVVGIYYPVSFSP